MGQTAVDKNGNRIRWDEQRKEWIPVETAVNKEGVRLEYDGTEWNPVGQQGEAPPVSDKIKTTVPSPTKTRAPYGLNYGLIDKSEPIKPTGKDILQAARQVAGQFIAFPVSTAVSAGLMTPGAGKITLPPEAAEMAGQRVGRAITGTPSTPEAQELARGMNAIPETAFGPLGKAIEAMPTPEARTAVSVAMLMFPYAKGLTKGFLAGKIKTGTPLTPKEVDAVIRVTPDIPADVAAQAKSGAPTASGAPVAPRPQDALVAALKQSKRVLPAQKAMYRQEAGERLAKAEDVGQATRGEAGVGEALSQMKGQMKKVDFEVPAIDPASREALFNMVWDNPYLKTGERLSLFGEHPKGGRSASGLIGMLDYGKFPAKHEVELMGRVFGTDVTDALIGKLSPKEKMIFWSTQIANIPRTIMASFDLSAPLRQGVWLIGRPRQFARSFADMFRSLKSEEGYNAAVEAMAKKPTFSLARESGLALTEIGSALTKTEERFIGSGVLERAGKAALKRWPGIVGRALNLVPEGIKASQRAYTGFLNKLRADTFDSMVRTAEDLGLYNMADGTKNINANPKLSQDIARYVNIATGRGNLKGLFKDHAALTNAVFFSPRLMSARIALFDPRTYFDVARPFRKGLEKTGFMEKGSEAKVNSFVRRAAISDLGKAVGFYATSAALAKYILGQEVGLNPRSSDYTKIVSGNTSVDLSGGIGSYFRLAYTMALPLFEKLGIVDEAYVVSSSTGKKTKMGGGFNEKSILDAMTTFLSQKENPIVSFMTDVLSQREKDISGKPYSVAKEIRDRFIPIVSQDFAEMYKDDPDGLKMAVMGMLTIFGAGVQTYKPRPEESFLGPRIKTREELGRLNEPGDRIMEEFRRLGVNTAVGKRQVGGKPVPESLVSDLAKEGEETFRKMARFYIDNPAYRTATDEQRKKWLQKAADTAWRLIKAEQGAKIR